MGADTLAHVLRPLTATFGAHATPDLLVGLGAADDAAVYRLNADQALVATVDFFPPVVDDPATYGAIAVTNALSDIYAMGGRPLLALNIVAFPDDLDPDILTAILRGGAEQAARAGVVIAGGHTVTDDEPKYGLAAIGFVHPAQIITKGGAQPGDAIILTKPIGTGIITTALKQDRIDEASAAYTAAVTSMTTFNAGALETVREVELAGGAVAIHAGTDITGFGLLGHLWEMLSASDPPLGARLRLADVPLLPGARDLAAAGIAPGGTARNLAAVAPHVAWDAALTATDRALLADPQTAGGLALAVPGAAAALVVAALAQAGITAWHIADITDSGMIEVA